jgi:DtxR family Mn-dependent transcriptional regulator
MMKVSPANEDYLEAIYDLNKTGGAVRSVDLAAKLDVSKASVNNAIKQLKAVGLVEQPYYGEITLTSDGMLYGASVLERHCVLERFLIEVLGVEESVAEEEACRMEHTISEDTMRRWIAYLKEQGLDTDADIATVHGVV